MYWIVTGDVEREIWRRILEFANVELAEASIARVHGDPIDKRAKANYRKQAQQMRVALLQAREYFEAADRTSLITSPNHIYYGMVSLASAAMLLLGTGASSYDALRKDTKNNHHGLSFTVDVPASRVGSGTALLDSSRVEVTPRGHFANWYGVLPSGAPAFAIVHNHLSGSKTTGAHVVGHESMLPISDLVGFKTTIVERIRLLPELSADINRFGIPVTSSSSTHEIDQYSDGQMTHRWVIKNAGSNTHLLKILDQFSFESGLGELIQVAPDIELPSTSGAIIKCRLAKGRSADFSWPSSRVTLNGDTLMYAESLKIPEFADWYLVAYGLSMLSRYFPDLWIACLDAHCRSAKLIEAFVECARLKVPTLVLEYLTGTPVRVSTHRAPWHS